MKEINIVLEGANKGNRIYNISKDKCLTQACGWSFKPPYISSYTVIDESNKDQYSFWKGALGVALFGGLGAIAGVNGKKKKEYLIAVEWKDGEKSLISLDEEYYKVFVKSNF